MSKHSNKTTGAKAAGAGNKLASQQSNNISHQDEFEPAKLDYTIAKHLRYTLPNKEAMFLGIKRVNYFIGSQAVDVLMESQWSEQMFPTRNDATLYLNSLLVKKLFHRARKIVKKDGEKKKFKLDMHQCQEFEDDAQPFVWIYEPTSITAWLLCFGVVFGVIAICLFPLWPQVIRTWTYYICVVALTLLGSILGLACIRPVIFAILWALTFGKLHFWLLPNLTEDVGFVESFWPIYTIESSTSEGGDDGNCGASSADSATKSVAPASSHSHQD